MSKSLKRVEAALAAAGIEAEIREVGQAHTAVEAAEAVGVSVAQIAKSILFRGETTGQLMLFITAGSNRVNPALASAVAGEALGKADADQVRRDTGFAIGGVSPVGHLNTPRCFWDADLDGFDVVWAAAGTPRHLFAIAPKRLQQIAQAVTAEFTLKA